MEVNIFLKTEIINIDYEKIIEKVKAAFALEFANDKTLSLIFVSKEEIREINKQYRNLDQVTDVISFSDLEEDYIGDIFICVDKLQEQAKEFKNSEEWEFAFLLIHGILHLSGFDHLSEEEELVMFKKQDEIIKRINIKK